MNQENKITYIPLGYLKILFAGSIISAMVGATFIYFFYSDYGNIRNQDGLTGGLLLVFISMFTYFIYQRRYVSAEIGDSIIWKAGAYPFLSVKQFSYSDIVEIKVGVISGLNLSLKDGTKLSLTSSSIKISGNLKDRNYPALPGGPIRELFLLKEEIEERRKLVEHR